MAYLEVVDLKPEQVAYGPVPSRRLGRSLGINNIPPKICSYSCIYCQLGRTSNMRVSRQTFYEPEELVKRVQEKVESARKIGESIDYLTFVPDGEPTLDINLGREIELLKPLGIKIAVITNASLISRPDVRDDLIHADWVSLKLDSTREDLWRRINRPQGTLRLRAILHGMIDFSSSYHGDLATETMLVRDLNDNDRHVEEVADFVAQLKRARAYLSIPTRPPAEKWVQPSREETIIRAYQTFSERLDKVEYLIGYEGNAFASTEDVEQDILSITAVHPMREQAVRELLARANVEWSVVEKLVTVGQLIRTEYEGRYFYMRKLHGT
jgi:wyosine [tRNA(Phe)-imidazoG37] synthetase (radical SAM superfamily)